MKNSIARIITAVTLGIGTIVPSVDAAALLIDLTDDQVEQAIAQGRETYERFRKERRPIDDLDPEYVIDEGGFGTRDVLAPGKLVYGISVADKRPYWIRVIASGPSGHGSQPIADNANLLLGQAIARMIYPPPPVSEIPIVLQMRRKLGALAENKFTNAIQRWVKEHTRLGIPVLFHEEALHGLEAEQATSFPQAIALASTCVTAAGMPTRARAFSTLPRLPRP